MSSPKNVLNSFFYYNFKIRHPFDETRCESCPLGTLPDMERVTCQQLPEVFLRPESGWAIGAMSLSSAGIVITAFVVSAFIRHHDTPGKLYSLKPKLKIMYYKIKLYFIVVRASGRELSYVLLAGILMCYSVTFALVLRPNDIVCGIQRYEDLL